MKCRVLTNCVRLSYVCDCEITTCCPLPCISCKNDTRCQSALCTRVSPACQPSADTPASTTMKSTRSEVGGGLAEWHDFCSAEISKYHSPVCGFVVTLLTRTTASVVESRVTTPHNTIGLL